MSISASIAETKTYPTPTREERDRLVLENCGLAASIGLRFAAHWPRWRDDILGPRPMPGEDARSGLAGQAGLLLCQAAHDYDPNRPRSDGRPTDGPAPFGPYAHFVIHKGLIDWIDAMLRQEGSGHDAERRLARFEGLRMHPWDGLGHIDEDSWSHVPRQPPLSPGPEVLDFSRIDCATDPRSGEGPEQFEADDQVRAGLDAMSPECREAVEIHFFEGIGREAACARLGVNTSTYYRRINRGLEQARRQLERTP